MPPHPENAPLCSSPDKGRPGGVDISEEIQPPLTPPYASIRHADCLPTPLQGENSGAVWDETRHTLGLDEMDATHREFVAQVAAAIAADQAEFPVLFQALVNHTAAHFKAEGVLMRASKYRGLPEHEGEHHRVLGELQQLNRSLKRGHLPLVRAYVKEGLMEWFDTHVAMMDAALAMHLKKQGEQT